jgi:hypothetical protein
MKQFGLRFAPQNDQSRREKDTTDRKLEKGVRDLCLHPCRVYEQVVMNRPEQDPCIITEATECNQDWIVG